MLRAPNGSRSPGRALAHPARKERKFFDRYFGVLFLGCVVGGMMADAERFSAEYFLVVLVGALIYGYIMRGVE